MEIVTMSALHILLAAVVFLGFYVEFHTGGTGAGALCAIVAAAVFFGSQYMEGLVNLYAVGIFMVGLICISIEILSPSVGAFAGIGLAALLYSFVLSFGGDLQAIYAMAVAAVLAVLGGFLVCRFLPKSSVWKKVALENEARAELGFVSAAERKELVGEVGEVLTDLRPAGTALLLGEPVDVVAEGAFLEKGKKVRVISVAGSRVLVRLVKE